MYDGAVSEYNDANEFSRTDASPMGSSLYLSFRIDAVALRNSVTGATRYAIPFRHCCETMRRVVTPNNCIIVGGKSLFNANYNYRFISSTIINGLSMVFRMSIKIFVLMFSATGVSSVEIRCI